MRAVGELLIIYGHPAIVTVVKRNGAFSHKRISWARYWGIIFGRQLAEEWKSVVVEWRKMRRGR